MQLAISFDFWNTLYADGDESQRKIQRMAYFRELANRYRQLTDLETEAAFLAASNFFLDEWKTRFRTPTATERIEYMARQLGIQFRQQDVMQLAEVFGNMVFQIPPQEISDVKRMIGTLSRQYRLGIISDTGYISGKYIRRFLIRENMHHHFRSMIFSDEQAHSKPHEYVFIKTAAALNVPIDRLVHIGDLERTDVSGAIGAGCVAVKYIGVHNDQNELNRAEYILENYGSLPDILKKIYSRRQ